MSRHSVAGSYGSFISKLQTDIAFQRVSLTTFPPAVNEVSLITTTSQHFLFQTLNVLLTLCSTGTIVNNAILQTQETC